MSFSPRSQTRSLAVWSLAVLLLGAGCGLSPVRPENPGMPLFTAKAVPSADELTPRLSRALNRGVNAGHGQGARDRLEIGPVRWTEEQGAGFDLIPVTVYGPKQLAPVPDTFKPKEYHLKKAREERRIVEEPYQSRTFSLTTPYRLLAASDGRVLAEGTAEVKHSFKYGGLLALSGLGPSVKKMPPAGAGSKTMPEALVNQLATRLMDQLASKSLEGPLTLDWGQDPQTATGVRVAQAGRWEEAQELWRGVVALNPRYAPAQYNLGVAEERRGDPESLARAREYYRAAQRNGQRPLYRQALTRVTARLLELGQPIKATLNP